MRKAIMYTLLLFGVVAGLNGQQTIKSQTLTTDANWIFPNQDCAFLNGAVIVTHGFKVTLQCRNLTGNGAQIISFQGIAASGANGANGAPGGHDGTDGGDASHGRNGGIVDIKAAKYIGPANSLRVILKGEDGGNGGKGGNGTPGVNGGPGDGPDVSDCWFGSCRRGGGNGGDGTDGGSGGYGGRGGDGGDAGQVLLAVDTGGESIGIELHGGLGGSGGVAGAGANGGQGGEGGNGHLCCKGGRRGADGRPGRAGRPGRDGRNGRGGEVHSQMLKGRLKRCS